MLDVSAYPGVTVVETTTSALGDADRKFLRLTMRNFSTLTPCLRSLAIPLVICGISLHLRDLIVYLWDILSCGILVAFCGTLVDFRTCPVGSAQRVGLLIRTHTHASFTATHVRRC